jgi:hypothetical protein
MIGLKHKITGLVEPDENEHRLLNPCIGTEYFLVPKDYINFWPCGHKCEHEGCLANGSVVCHVPDIPDATGKTVYDGAGIEIIEHLCADHAYESGYCICCGDFWSGIECFDFDNPSHLCDNCKEQIDSEQCDYDDDDELLYLGLP